MGAEKKDTSMYYNINNTLARNKLFNFVVGPRGSGKTYGAKKKAIENWLENGEQFVYLRRYETEMPQAEIKKFFDDMIDAFPDHEFTVHNGTFRIDKMVVGWYFALSKSQLLKSVPFPNVTMIIFDEFIINIGVYHYLPQEVTTFLECYSTIARDRDVTALFLSNSVTMFNPYFLYFNLSLEKGQRIKLLDDISLEYIENRSFTKHMKSTRFGRLIAGTKYEEYSIDNQFLLDTPTFIEQMKNPCHYIATFVFDGCKLGLYLDNTTNLYYLSEKVSNDSRQLLAMSSDVHNTNTQLLSRTNVIYKLLFDAYAEGNLRFETQHAKSVSSKILKSSL